ncbi:hypothetical protein ISF_05999 [Cordyceps fumosorosea ARSEF 2679]|uniref:Methyltransferase domain-containing protein n=1 Tax=Cordyceps fumosorosea (strain ARSEF 2679) TaxID=1081104 RepID=A0A167SW47_CORFA|nr:hypothetical protein ISF_05999 [Cordyceps fumosorosea ARSEF 2679]OAA59988.1 hypothetical protein ISF_05999 [Cordyceps fumosorosea ARSEF 2679]
MTQYDHIGAQYEQANEQFYKFLEGKLMENALRPEIADRPGLKLLEFAAGTGFYTSRALAWSAPDTSLTSMDISRAMLDVTAGNNATAVSSGRLRLLLADGAHPRSYAPDDHSEEYFDGAFGGWFLNYAEGRETLRSMFDNIALNLRPGGFFVGVVPYPEEDLAARGRACKEPPLRDIYPFLDFTRPLEDGSGWWFTCHVDETLSFETAHHRRSVFEEVAREAGFSEMEWSPANLPREEFISRGAVVKNDLSPEVYKAYADVGILAVIKVYKK